VSHRQQSHREAKRALAELDTPEEAGEQPRRYSRSGFFRQPLPADAIRALLRVPPHSGELHFTPMGGAYNRVAPDATAFAHRGELFLLEHAAADPAWATESWTAVRPWASGRVYPNFPDPELTDWREAYYGDNHARLISVKRRYDPGDVFHVAQSLA
jgi:hypothetical protein